MRTSAKRFLLRFQITWMLQLLFSERSYLRSVGWFHSMKKHIPIDARGTPIPWLTYPALYFIETKWKSDLRVLELGAGNGTVWISNRCQSCHSYEDDPQWAARIRKMVNPQTTNIIIRDPTDFSIPDAVISQADILIIDSLGNRSAWVDLLAKVQPHCVVIWDNSDRQDYSVCKKTIDALGFKEVHFVGPTPCTVICSRTTILYRNENIFDI